MLVGTNGLPTNGTEAQFTQNHIFNNNTITNSTVDVSIVINIGGEEADINGERVLNNERIEGDHQTYP